MAFNLTVRANVVDITAHTPQPTDRFLVDTNVWYWQTYIKASQATDVPAPYQLTEYPQYLKKALDVGATLVRSGLTLVELAHVIERTEKDIHQQSHGDIRLKAFRHLSAPRKVVVREIRSAWLQVQAMATDCPAVLDETLAAKTVTCLGTSQVDGYDALIVEAALPHGIVQVLTDDADFCTVPGITVYSANRTLVREARKARRLLA